MSQSLLLSDLHLSDARTELSAAFAQFCQTAAREADELFIIGNLADAWVGPVDDSAAATIIRNQLSALTVEGVNIYVLIDERDLNKGKELSTICGVNLMRDPSFKRIETSETLLVHGDVMCVDDDSYAAFVAQINNPLIQQMLQSEPMQERRRIAVEISTKNQQANAAKMTAECRLECIA